MGIRKLALIFEGNLQTKFFMKKYLFVLLLALCLLTNGLQAQEFYAKLDSLPPITIKKNIPLVAASVYFGGYLFANCNHYLVANHDFYGTSPLQFYLYAPQDSTIINLYQKHRSNRTIWLITSPVAATAGVFAFAYLIASIFKPSYAASAAPYLVIGYAALGVSLATRITSFSQLRRAVNLYNFKYASKTRLSLGVAPASSGAGLGIVARF